jgi:hypothetical protein
VSAPAPEPAPEPVSAPAPAVAPEEASPPAATSAPPPVSAPAPELAPPAERAVETAAPEAAPPAPEPPGDAPPQSESSAPPTVFPGPPAAIEVPAGDPRAAEAAELEARIAADREQLRQMISTKRWDSAELASDPEIRAIAERLPRLQAELAALRAETVH